MRLFKAALIGVATRGECAPIRDQQWMPSAKGYSTGICQRLPASVQHLSNFNRAAALGAALELHRSLEQ